MTDVKLGRRAALGIAMASVIVVVKPTLAQELQAPTQAALRRLIGDKTPSEGRVTLRLPPIAENGNTVPLTVQVESPMTPADHVKAIHILADKNPSPEVASFKLTPALGKAQAETRIRLGTTQDVVAVAEMSDGSVYMTRAEVKVTIGGCGG
jgi:sulfur-oxidizing protein SoxY